jgi:hypothetical protein
MARALSSRALCVAIAAGVALSFAAAPAARADTIDAATRGTARKLGQDAVKLFEAGSYAAALDKFNTADSLVPAPTLGLYAARCLVKLGRLVEASERYLAVTRMQLEPGALPVMRKAQATAVAEREKLLPTLPTLEVRLEGPSGDGVEVSVDARPILPALLGEKRPVDPGKHRLDARRADTTVSRDVSIALGDAARVVLTLPPLPAPPAPRMPALRKMGWVAVGVAGAGVVTGSVAGLVALAKGKSLLSQCPDHQCPTAGALALAGPYDAARAASTAGFIAGAVGLAVGIPILVVSPKVEYAYADGRPAPPPKDAPGATGARALPPRASFTPWVTWGGAGVRGIF